jgi:hypothetical protein
MLPLIPLPPPGGRRLQWKPVSEHALVKAHLAAEDHVAALRGEGARMLALRAAGLIGAGAMPLLVYMLFGWPLPMLVLPVVIDNAAVALSDFILRVRACDAADAERDRVDTLESAIGVASAMSRARVRSGRGPIVHRVSVSDATAHQHYLRHSLACTTLILLSLWAATTAANLPTNHWTDVTTWLVLAMPLVLRPIGALATARRALQQGGIHPQLGRQVPQMLALLLLASGLFAVAVAVGEALMPGLFRQHGAELLLGSYFGAAVAIALSGILRARRAVATLARFAAMERNELREQLRLRNGATSMRSRATAAR